MNFSNESDSIVYYSNRHKKIIDQEEAMNQASDFSPNAYFDFKFNGLYTLRQPGIYKYFQGLASVPPKTTILVSQNNYKIIKNLPTYIIEPSLGLNDLIESIELLQNQYLGKKIGVELSGGLDSSLVIEALLKLKIDPVLIGFSSDEFEFRTEREIQRYYQDKVSTSKLLKYEENKAFDNLKATPFHPIPVSESHFFQRHKTMATEASKLNIEILFSGEAGDQLLSFPLDLKLHNEIPLSYGYWCLAEHWSNQYVYKNFNLQYTSALALGSIPSILLSLRNGQKFDPMKIWARNYFKNCLPDKLSKFAYTAFHNGWVKKGLFDASETIEEICEFSFSHFKLNELRPDYIKKMAQTYGQLSENDKKSFLIKLAYSTWFYSVNKNYKNDK